MASNVGTYDSAGVGTYAGRAKEFDSSPERLASAFDRLRNPVLKTVVKTSNLSQAAQLIAAKALCVMEDQFPSTWVSLSLISRYMNRTDEFELRELRAILDDLCKRGRLMSKQFGGSVAYGLPSLFGPPVSSVVLG